MKRVLAVCGSPEHWPAGYSLPYEQALRAAGMEPVLIAPGADLPGGIAGLVLMGGSDVNPARYGKKRRDETESSDDARDELESSLIQNALEGDLPILAICRGLQMLNVQHGGTLTQHLDTTERHRVRTADKGAPAHQVEIVAGTLLARIAGEPRTMDVNSRHHQAIDRLGNGLVISARDPRDGIIEAVERPDKRFVVGVQWHPENMSAKDERQARIFEAFAAELEERKASGGL
jgi:gamma-glutamyl-gamma-aminobutyrate hydrolase PuuD